MLNIMLHKCKKKNINISKGKIKPNNIINIEIIFYNKKEKATKKNNRKRITSN